MSLTDARIRTLKIGDKVDRLIADGNGLYLRLRCARGAINRTWQYRSKEAGKLHVTALGTYPAMSLRDAACEPQNWPPGAMRPR